MPEWGLTDAQIRAEPWGLREELLRPQKKITDPVHGDIYLNALEVAVLDTSPMQRLRRVRQLGTTHLVYPGATHTRFSHALGTLRAAQNLMDVVLRQGSGRHPVPDLFAEWRSPESADDFERKVGEATVLARLGGLLHDLGHVPYGHTLEDDLNFFPPHDANVPRYDHLWSILVRELGKSADGAPNGVELPPDLTKQLRRLILSKDDEGSGEGRSREESGAIEKYPFVSDLVGNTICADLIDYLQRDHLYAGLPAAFGRRFLDGFYVTRSDHSYRAQRMVIRIRKDGRLRADVVSELFKYLRYRYELSERALAHHAKLAADVMIGKTMEMWKAALETEMSAEEATAHIEQQVLRRGDDGLLEHLLDQAEKPSAGEQWQDVAGIAIQLQRRTLFKAIGVYTNRAMADKIHARVKSPDERTQIEQNAADSAGVEHGWMVALWVPNPEMRFKPAQVLVDDGSAIEIVPLEAWDSENGKRGSEIFESHHRLWEMRVYVDRRVSKTQRDAVLDTLREQLGISEWDGPQHSATQDGGGRGSTGGQPTVVVGADRVDSASMPAERAPIAEETEQSSLDSDSSDAAGRLTQWRTSGGISIEHPNLEATLSAAQGSVVQLGAEQFNLAEPEAIVRLNLTLFLRELDENVFDTPAGRSRVVEAISKEPSDFENRVLAELSDSPVARRKTRSPGETDPRALAFELAVRKYLDGDQSARLL